MVQIPLLRRDVPRIFLRVVALRKNIFLAGVVLSSNPNLASAAIRVPLLSSARIHLDHGAVRVSKYTIQGLDLF